MSISSADRTGKAAGAVVGLMRVVYKRDVRAVNVGRHDYRIFYTAGRSQILVRNVRSSKRRRPWTRPTLLFQLDFFAASAD
jgi:hypothetical protein